MSRDEFRKNGYRKYTRYDSARRCPSAHIRRILPRMSGERESVMAESTPGTEGNRLLASLPREEMERLLPHLGRVSFALGEVIYESGGRQSYIYFPTTAIISLLYLMENGSSAEMGI